jgi:predicted transcriptional regulator
MLESKSLRVAAKRRNQYDIVAEILRMAAPSRKKTHIMYEAKLSYYQINEYLNFLVAKGLLASETMKYKGKTLYL